MPNPRDRDLHDLRLVHTTHGRVEQVTAHIDPKDGKALRAHLVAALRRNDRQLRDLANYRLEVRRHGRNPIEHTFTATPTPEEVRRNGR